MKRRLVWTRQGREDLSAIADYIAVHSPAAADRFVDRLLGAMWRLEDLPFSGSVVAEINREDVREVLHGNYRIIYRVRDDLVEVLAIMHGARLLSEDIWGAWDID